MKEIIQKLYETSDLSDNELKMLIDSSSDEDNELLRSLADEVRQRYYGKDVFLVILSGVGVLRRRAHEHHIEVQMAVF